MIDVNRSRDICTLYTLLRFGWGLQAANQNHIFLLTGTKVLLKTVVSGAQSLLGRARAKNFVL